MWRMQGFWKGVRLHFEFYNQEPGGVAADAGGSSSGGKAGGGMRVIDIPRMNRFEEQAPEILQKLVARFGVPADRRWERC